MGQVLPKQLRGLRERSLGERSDGLEMGILLAGLYVEVLREKSARQNRIRHARRHRRRTRFS